MHATRTAHPAIRSRLFRTLLLALLCTHAALSAAEELRLGFSSAMITGSNLSDVRASMRALILTVTQEKNLQANPDPTLLTGTVQIEQALHRKTVDAVALTVDEYWGLLRQHGQSAPAYDITLKEPLEEFVLLARKDLGAARLADLAGRRLILHDSSRTRIGFCWLNLLLAREDLPDLPEFFGERSRQTKLSKVVFDVFFRKADCCLVSKKGFAAMAELNPQIGAQLAPVASSQPLLTRLFAYRPGVTPEYKEEVMRVFTDLHRSAAGRQALTIFQVDLIAEQPPEKLRETLALLEELGRLRPAEAARLAREIRVGNSILNAPSR